MVTRCSVGQSATRTARPYIAALAVAFGLCAQGPVVARPGGQVTVACAPSASPASPPRDFLGYPCRDQRCGSHKAGFDWAERNRITAARACVTRNDAAFTEGCRVFAEQVVTAEQAGFQWARENDLVDPCQCAGAGARFEAGCEAYVHGLAD